MQNVRKRGRIPMALFYVSLVHACAFLAFAETVTARGLVQSKNKPVLAGTVLLPSDRDLARDVATIPDETIIQRKKAQQEEDAILRDLLTVRRSVNR